MSRERLLVALPPPRPGGVGSLEGALAHRRSVREFSAERLTDGEISQLLWAAQGITEPGGGRTVPSAGATFPLGIYVLSAAGLARYVPHGHQLEPIRDEDVREALARAALDQDAVRDAPMVIVIVAVAARMEARYGRRAARYVTLEAGHATQNVLLEATVLGLGAVPIGAFEDRSVARVLDLPPGEEPLYLIAVGHQAGRRKM